MKVSAAVKKKDQSIAVDLVFTSFPSSEVVRQITYTEKVIN